MLVPRSFKYSSSPPPIPRSNNVNETRPKSKRLFSDPLWSNPLSASISPRSNPISESYPIASPASVNMRQPSQPVEIPLSRGSNELGSTRGRAQAVRKSRPSNDTHRSDSVSPAVAALLAGTAIPPPRIANPRRKKSGLSSRRISIDELVQEWRNDSSLRPSRPSFGSSASLGLLLESAEDSADERSSYSRSSSCESIPSLDGEDDQSVMSVMSIGSPATPPSVTSQQSSQMASRKEKNICLLEAEDCGLDHPLGWLALDDYDTDVSATPTPKSKDGRKRLSSSFKSNLTSSLQALKSRALSSLSSLNQAMSQADAAFSDETLWQHPQLFPRLSSEIRPTPFISTPTRSQRRYFNPTPLSFEEQQHHWQRALSALDSDDTNTPMIQMQTYRRSSPSPSRKSRRNSGTPDSKTEAGRALAGSTGSPQSRQREVRENSDFLRVIVLEMNMRRKGKLEDGTAGRAKIWLPPRKVSAVREDVFDEEGDEEELTEGPVGRKVPRRWVGVSANY